LGNALQIRTSERGFIVIFRRIRRFPDSAAYCSAIIAILPDGLLRTGLEVCLARKGSEISQLSKSVPAAKYLCWLLIAN
jgi:hypothetical protein